MINHAASFHVGQRLSGQAAALFFLVNPRGQSVIDNPDLGATLTCCKLIDSLSQLHWDARRGGPGLDWADQDGLLIRNREQLTLIYL